MSTSSSRISDQFAPLLRTFWGGGGLVLGLLALVAWLAPRDDFRVAEVTRDVQAVAELPFYTGGLSTLGLLLWSASAAMCFLTYAVLRAEKDSPLIRLLGLGGAFTLLLLLDDAYMLHDRIFPLLDLPGAILSGLYGVIVGGLALRYRTVWARTPYFLILLSLCGLGTSVLVDGLVDARLLGVNGIVYLAEDGSKLIGIVLWTSYVGHTCAMALREERFRMHDEGDVANGELSRRDSHVQVLPFSTDR